MAPPIDINAVPLPESTRMALLQAAMQSAEFVARLTGMLEGLGLDPQIHRLVVDAAHIEPVPGTAR